MLSAAKCRPMILRIFAGRQLMVKRHCVHTCVRQFENEHNTRVYNLGPIYCCESYKTQESPANAGRTARFAVNVDTYRIFDALCTSAQSGIEIACRPSVRLSLSVRL